MLRIQFRWIYCFLLVAALCCYGASGFFNATISFSTAEPQINVLWTYPSPISDFGYSFMLDRARLELDENMEQLSTYKSWSLIECICLYPSSACWRLDFKVSVMSGELHCVGK